MPDANGKMTEEEKAELNRWWVACLARHAATDEATPPVLVTGPGACERCGGVGRVAVRWIGRVRCGACGGSGSGKRTEAKEQPIRKKGR